MRFEQFKTAFRSLRFRLSAWNTAAVLLIVVVTLVGVREALRFTLHDENDHLLKDDTYEVALAVETFYPNNVEVYREMDRKAEGHIDRKLFVQLIDTDGRILSSSGKPPDLRGVSLPQAEDPSLLTLGGYRVAQRVLTKAGMPTYTVRVGASLDTVDDDVAKLTLDLATRRVTREDNEIELTPTEFSLLELLMRYSGHIVTRRMLCEHLWETDWEGATNVIEVHINRLRGKLDKGFDESVIQTVRGRGYALRAV